MPNEHQGDTEESREPASTKPRPRNPFDEGGEFEDERPPALIDSQRSAAIIGVVVGLLALFFVVAICVAASYAFG